MRHRLKVFLRVLRSYSIEEKVISIIVFGVVLFTLAQSGLDFLRVRSSAGEEQGNIYNEALLSDKPLVLNPLYVDFNDASRDVSSLIFSGLVKYDSQKRAFVDDLGVLAISRDRKTYNFTLKDKLKWHDGEALTTDDVYYTFHDLIQNPKFQNPVPKLNFEGIEIKIISAKSIEFKLQKPNAFFISNLNIGIVPRHILANIPIEQLPSAPFNFKPVGSGSYKVDAPVELMEDGRQRVVLKVYEDYYGQRPKIRQIRFGVYPDIDLLLKQIGTVNVVPKLGGATAPLLQKLNRFTFTTYELPQYNAIFLNLQNPVLKKEKVRLALLKAIDKQQLLQILKDKIRVDTPMLELNQSEWIYKPNLKEAQGALFDSGYKLGKPDNLWRKNFKGEVLKFILLARSFDDNFQQKEEMRNVTDFLLKSWEQLGVKVELQAVDAETFKDRLARRDYDMILAGQSLGYSLDTYSYWHSSQTAGSGLNLSNYKSFAADQLIEAIRDTFDAGEKDKKLKELAKVLAKDVPAIFLYRPKYIFAADGRIKGFKLQNMAYASDRFAHVEELN